jgi:hypothetical protein
LLFACCVYPYIISREKAILDCARFDTNIHILHSLLTVIQGGVLCHGRIHFPL